MAEKGNKFNSLVVRYIELLYKHWTYHSFTFRPLKGDKAAIMVGLAKRKMETISIWFLEKILSYINDKLSLEDVYMFQPHYKAYCILYDQRYMKPLWLSPVSLPAISVCVYKNV